MSDNFIKISDIILEDDPFELMTFNKSDLIIEIKHFKNGDYHYSIDLKRCCNAAELLDWIYQLHQKEWCTPAHISEFLNMMDYLCDEYFDGNVQSQFCPSGKLCHVEWK